jgi:hypothetical protein
VLKKKYFVSSPTSAVSCVVTKVAFAFTMHYRKTCFMLTVTGHGNLRLLPFIAATCKALMQRVKCHQVFSQEVKNELN